MPSTVCPTSTSPPNSSRTASTPGSKEVLLGWYPRTKLEMDEARRTQKRGKFGSVKYVYPKDVMSEMRAWFEREIAQRLPDCRILYWT